MTTPEHRAPEGGGPVSEMQERIARALVISRGGAIVASDADWPDVVRHYREMSAKYPGYTKGFSLITDAFRDALAAMKAMREPTAVMIPPGRGSEAERTRYRAMIDREISIAEGGKDGD